MKPHRFTVRRLMVAVAIVALTTSTVTWANRRWREAEAYHQERLTYHRSNASFCRFWLETKPPVWVPTPFPPPTQADVDRTLRLAEYHEAMMLKHERATRYPWLPVPADPPAPE